jgi:hypothetical protein
MKMIRGQDRTATTGTAGDTGPPARTAVGLPERGERAPRIGTLIRLAGAMTIPPGELVDGIDWVQAPELLGAFTFH